MTLTQVQHALNVLGFPDDSGAALVEDGKLGPKTISAVKRFQGASGLVVDGKPGPMTQAELGAQLAAQANPSQAASGTSTGFLGGNPWRYVA
jgi:peptidoglycan hydrolase-like protein with peptidoglycan-binding domain